jgi:hypothetical protein
VLSQEVAVEQLRGDLAELWAQFERKLSHPGHLFNDRRV